MTLQQYLNVFDVFTKQRVLLQTYQLIKTLKGLSGSVYWNI